MPFWFFRKDLSRGPCQGLVMRHGRGTVLSTCSMAQRGKRFPHLHNINHFHSPKGHGITARCRPAVYDAMDVFILVVAIFFRPARLKPIWALMVAWALFFLF